MDFPRFKTPDGEDLIVNPDRIDAVTNRAGKTSIVVSGVAHVVDGTVDDVLAILGGNPAAQEENDTDTE